MSKATPRDSSSSRATVPTFRVGVSALIEYCGTIETSLKRNAFIFASFAIGSSRPSSSTRPRTCLMRESMRIRLFPRLDLPHPDSPARPMISPSAISNVAPSTAFTSPRSER